MAHLIDREKVIRGLRDIDMFIAGRLGHEKAKNFLHTIDETIALLKEQEAVEPIKDEVGLIHCGNCNAMLEHHPFYCWNCGQKVKLE